MSHSLYKACDLDSLILIKQNSYMDFSCDIKIFDSIEHILQMDKVFQFILSWFTVLLRCIT